MGDNGPPNDCEGAIRNTGCPGPAPLDVIGVMITGWVAIMGAPTTMFPEEEEEALPPPAPPYANCGPSPPGKTFAGLFWCSLKGVIIF